MARTDRDAEAGENSVATPLSAECSLRQDNRISGTLQDYGPLLAVRRLLGSSNHRDDRLTMQVA